MRGAQGFRTLLAVAAGAFAAVVVSFDVAALACRGSANCILAQAQPPTSPTPSPPAPKETGKPEPSAPKNLEPLPPGEVINILGKKVRGTNNEDLGLVVDVVVDAEGNPRAAVVDFGGFLGVGSRKIAVDWRLLRFSPGNRDHPVSLSLGRPEIQAAPEYKPDAASAAMVGPPPETPASSDVER
jgi:PRC-barrel domain protein